MRRPKKRKEWRQVAVAKAYPDIVRMLRRCCEEGVNCLFVLKERGRYVSIEGRVVKVKKSKVHIRKNALNGTYPLSQLVAVGVRPG